MKHFVATYKIKITTSSPGEVYSYRLSPELKKHIRAKFFSEAVVKVRNEFKYKIVNISIKEDTRSWIQRLIKKS